MTEVLHLTSENFDTAIASGVSLIDFWAPTCGPCKMLSPVIDQIAAEVTDDVTIAKVNIEEAGDIAVKYSVRSIPTIFILKDGEIVEQFVGVKDKQSLIDAIENAK